MDRIDHLVYATQDLAAGVRTIESLLGVTATPGGQHPRLGTRNALVSLGPTTYLEIVGPDPDQPRPAKPRPFGIDGLREARLVTWAVRTDDLDRSIAAGSAAGIHFGPVAAGGRSRPDGVLLSWSMTDIEAERAGGVIPFLIDWEDSPHPAASLPACCTVVSLRATHPEPEAVEQQLEAIGISLPVERAADPRILAVVEGAGGRVTLK